MVEKRPLSVIPITPSKEAGAKQRAALHTMLANDEEYHELSEYIAMGEEIGSEIVRELKTLDGEDVKLAHMSTKNVMKVLQYDIQGYPSRTIAKLINLPAHEVVRIRTTDAYLTAKEQVLGSVVEGARKYMEVATLKAVKTLVECLESSNEKIRLAAAQDVLSRTGLNAPQQIEITQTVNNFENYSDEELLEIMKKENFLPKHAEVISVGPDKGSAE